MANGDPLSFSLLEVFLILEFVVEPWNVLEMCASAYNIVHISIERKEVV